MIAYTRMLKKYCLFSGSQEKVSGNPIFHSYTDAKQLAGTVGNQDEKGSIFGGIHSQLFLFDVR